MTGILSNGAAIYSALTDFAGCGFYILLLKKSMSRWQRCTSLLMAVIAEICFLVMTPGLPYGWQIPASLATAARWLLYICYNGRDGIGQMIYRFIKGFVFAEIIAFMQWQMYSFLNGYGTMMPLWQKAGFLVINLVFYSMVAMMEIW